VAGGENPAAQANIATATIVRLPAIFHAIVRSSPLADKYWLEETTRSTGVPALFKFLAGQPTDKPSP
jgi:hypothetical protein